jgi:hypothetical protein
MICWTYDWSGGKKEFTEFCVENRWRMSIGSSVEDGSREVVRMGCGYNEFVV